MHVIAINGSPRKKWNTATLLENALDGASARGASTEMVHLYDLNYKGCLSCFTCKLKSGSSYGACVVKDELQPVLQKIAASDALILGSPIYYGMVSGEMRSFLERLLFQYLVYDAQYSSLRPKAIPTALIYTMNINAEGAKARNYSQALDVLEGAIRRTLSGKDLYTLHATDTCQFDDYVKYGVTAFNPEHKARRRREVLPQECEKAFDLGAHLVADQIASS